MKQFLLLLVLAGLSYSYKTDVHYKYKYYGSVSTGIPELSSLASAWAMKADVNVYVEVSKGAANFQLQNVLFAEFNDKLGCDSRNEIPHEYFKPIENAVLAAAIENVFQVHLFDNKNISIEYFEDGIPWLVNLRKGIAAVFENEVLRGNNDDQIAGSIASMIHEGHVVDVFTVEEETIFGDCSVEYSLHRIPEHLAISKDRELKSYIEEDEQTQIPETSALRAKTSSKTSKKYTSKTSKKSYSKTSKTAARLAISPAMKIDDTLWHVVRTVNFDRCDEVVGFQGRSMEGSKNVFGGHVDWRRSRSSVTEYIFRGSPGNFRMEKAIVEGATTLSPLAFQTEILQGRVNQTYYLVSAIKTRSIPYIDEELDVINNSPTWNQEVWSFATPPKYSKSHPWIHYTGKGHDIGRFETYGMDHATGEEIALMKNTIIDKITTVSLILTDLEQEDTDAYSGSPAEDLHHVTFFFKFLPKETILEIFKHFFAKDLHQSDILAKKLVIDAAVASGYYAAIDSVLDYIKEGKIPDLQIITILTTISSNVECPSSLPNILEWILTLDITEKPFVTTIAVINFAHMVSEICIFPNARNVKYAGQLYGDYGCKVEIKDKFSIYIQKLISHESDWVKVVGIEALDALAIPASFQILAPIIEGKVKCSTRVRYYAIFALASWNFNDHKQLKEPIVDFLTGIYTDYGVSVSLREAALDTVATWDADAAFWHTIARQSWREPSKQFASFMTSLIKAYAESNDDYNIKSVQAASHALKFARPVIPNHDYSELLYNVDRDFSKHIERTLGFAVFKSKSLKHLTEIYSFMMYDLGGLQVLISESYAIASDLFIIKRVVDDFNDEKPALNNIAERIAKDFYTRIEDTIKTKSTRRDPKHTLELSWKLFNHIRYFLPINTETIRKLPYTDMTSIGELLVQLTMGYDLVLGKFFNPFSFTSFHATEIGIPFFTHGVSPIVLTDVSFSTLTSESKKPSIEFIQKGELSMEALSSFSSMYQTSISFLLPWNKKVIQTGVKSKRDFTTPVKEVIKGNQLNDGGQQNIVHVDFESQYKKKFSLAKASNVPYTAILPIYPEKEPSFSIKKIVKTEPRYKNIQPFPVKYTGLELDLKVGSEASLPYTFFGREDILSPFEISEAPPMLFYALVSPTVKFWEIDLTFDPQKSTTKKISFELMLGEFGQSKPESFTQERGDFYQYGQEGVDQYDQEQSAQTPSFDFQEGFQEIGGDGSPEVETLGHVNYGDSLQQRSQKMQEYFGGHVRTASLKIDLDGDEHRSYEILFSKSKSKVDDLTKIKKFQLSLIRSPIPQVDDNPASVCFDVQKSLPKITSLDTFKGVLNRNLKKEVKAEITLGCTGKPVFVAKGSFEVTDAWKEKYAEHIHEACEYDQLNPLHTLKQHVVYDQAKFTVSWDKVCDPKRFPITSRIFDVTEHILGTGLLDADCTDEAEREIGLNIYRCPVNSNWYMGVSRGKTTTNFENIPHDPVFNLLFGVAIKMEDSDFVPSHETQFNLESDKCIVGVDQVRTFDGFIYEYHPTQCWTVAFKDCLLNRNMLLVRSPQGESSLPEARYLDLDKGLVIDFSRNTLRVNGKIVDPVGGPEIIKDEEDKVTLVTVYKKDNFYKIRLDENLYILFKDQIEVKVDLMLWGHTCGLCGNSDGEDEAELIGPHRCLFSDPNLFVSSWTAGSDTCDLYTLMELREEVEKFQETKCHVVEEYEDKCGHRNTPCIYYEWHIVHSGKDYDVCVSQRTLSFCEPECQIVAYEEKEYTYSCWPQEHVPELLKIALANNQTTIGDPIIYEPYYETTFEHQTPITCKSY